MLQGYSGKHWVQIPRKQAVFVHSWYSQSSPWEWREDEVYYVQRGCCRYVQSFIIMFFFLTSRSSPRVFFREKDIRLFSVFAFLPLRNRGCHQPVELGVNSPSVHVYLNDFQFICHFASVAVNFECGGLSFFATLSKVEKKLNKIGTLKKFEMRFWKKKKRENCYFSDVFHSDRKHVTFSCRQTSRCRSTELLCSFISIIIVGNVQFCTSVFVLGRLQKLRTFITTIVVL